MPQPKFSDLFLDLFAMLAFALRAVGIALPLFRTRSAKKGLQQVGDFCFSKTKQARNSNFFSNFPSFWIVD
jgi:hypothetical protein